MIARIALVFWRIGRSDGRRWWRAIRSPNRPRWLIPTSAALAAFVLFPVSWAIPVIGVIDALIIAPALFHWMASKLPPMDRPRGR